MTDPPDAGTVVFACPSRYTVALLVGEPYEPLTALEIRTLEPAAFAETEIFGAARTMVIFRCTEEPFSAALPANTTVMV
ncbi:MAG: hypothetical protein M3Y77_09085 [Actinomycetota bacterium]|nr:hypothetical protein [Actinomycetota bacterium]